MGRDAERVVKKEERKEGRSVWEPWRYCGGEQETLRRNRTGLPDDLRDGMEALTGLSLDDVRVHYGSHNPGQVHAYAYTRGSQIDIGPGQERYLPHELGHVIQQKQGRVQPTVYLGKQLWL